MDTNLKPNLFAYKTCTFNKWAISTPTKTDVKKLMAHTKSFTLFAEPQEIRNKL